MPESPEPLRSPVMASGTYRPLTGGSPTARPLPGLLPERLRPPPAAVDLLVAAATTMLMAASSIAVSGDSSGRAMLGRLVLVLVAGSALWWRRRLPFAVLGVEMATVIAEGATSAAPATAIGMLVAVYTAATVRSRHAALVGAAAATGALVAGAAVHGDLSAGLVLSGALAVTAATAYGLYVGTRRAYVEQLAERAATLEREHELLAAQVVAGERTRIARELHDVVAHHVSLMVVQGGAARETLGAAHPLGPTLDALADTGREALAEMRRMLGLLRADTTVEHAPQPGLGDLPALVGQVHTSGLTVDVVEVGDIGPVAPGVGLAAYRIAQEALTNSIRHGGARHATITLRSSGTALEIEVVDDGRPGSAVAADGHGLVGMRERVALYDGVLDAGPISGGGYRVRARFAMNEPA